MKKLFVSQPYGDRPEEEVIAERDRIAFWAEQIMGELFEVIDQYRREEPEHMPKFYHLSQDLLLLGEADLVAFAPNWAMAKGCRVEHELVMAYGIPFIDFSC